MLEKIILGPEKATSAVIWLHGLGADGNDFVPVVPELIRSGREIANTRFVFPHAPLQPVTLNQGAVMRAWYDIQLLSARVEEDEIGIKATQSLIQTLIEEQIKTGIPSQRVVLAGFSQGGAMALYTGLRFKQPLGGILALSTYLPLPHRLESEKSADNQDIPIWMAHGLQDDMIPLTFAKLALQHLRGQGYSPLWNTFEMGHQVCPAEISAIGKWLQTLFLDRKDIS